MPVRAVLLDAGATLLHPDPPVEIVYARELTRLGLDVSRDRLGNALSGLWNEVRSEPGERYGGVRGEEGFWREFLNRLRRRLDGQAMAPESFERLAAHFRSPRSWTVYPDVRPALAALRERGLALAVVSNWDSHLPGLLEGIGLAPHFAAVAVSAIEEVGKPDAEIFRRVCARLTVSPAEALHVGDLLEEDYEGARGAGLHALLLDRDGRHPGHPDRISSLHEIGDRLDAIA
jgi:putative hydrolase of the HAD superfamily